jgi:hypothetical protein
MDYTQCTKRHATPNERAECVAARHRERMSEPWPEPRPSLPPTWARGFLDSYSSEPTAPPEPEPFDAEFRVRFIATLKVDDDFCAAVFDWLKGATA